VTWHRVESSADDRDDAIRLLRQAIFGLEQRLDGLGVRQRVLRMCAGLSPVPEITFAGPVDDALSAEAGDQLLDMLHKALQLIGPDAARTSVDLSAGEALSVIVTWTGLDGRSADGNGYSTDFDPLRDTASQAGITIEIGSGSGSMRMAWSIPIRSG
jgi:hypothetical protein